VLLTAVVVAAVVVPGAALTARYVDQTSVGSAVADFSVRVNETTVTLTDIGGDDFARADLRVIFRRGSQKHRFTLDSVPVRGDGDAKFEPGETVQRAHGFGPGALRVLVVDRATRSVLFEKEKTVPGTATTTPPTSNNRPTASFTASCDGVSCTFDASSSADSDGTVASYDWTFGDGATGSGVSPTHDYAARGTYQVNLTVTDDDGATDTMVAHVDVVPKQPSITGVVVTDQSANSVADYRVDYDVNNTVEFDHVEVVFDDQVNDWADATVNNTSARGHVEYSVGGAEGDSYDITVRAYNQSGAVTDSLTRTDVADGGGSTGGNLSSPSSPKFAGVVVDDVSAANATYEVSYNVTNRSEFGSVEVTVEDLTNGWASATYTSSDPRDNVDNYSQPTYGDSYRITVTLRDASGVVVDRRVVNDTADGTDPSGNDDLGRAGSPTLANWVVSDLSSSGQGAAYNVTYAANNTTEFAGVEVVFRDRDSRYASEISPVLNSTTGTYSYRPGYAYGDQYEIEIRVVDADGIVVDEHVVNDTADGTDSGGNNPPSSLSDPAFAGVVVDDVSVTQATYEVSYNVTNRNRFDHVQVQVEDLDSGWASATYTSSDPRDNVDNYSQSTYGDSYRITVSLVDDDGFVVDRRVVNDTADGTDPSGNDDLGRAGSPTLSSYSVTDKSNNGKGARYDVQYNVTPNAEFAGVEIIFRNRDSRYASEISPVLNSTTGTYSYRPGYAYGDQYEIEIRTVDADGIVVDQIIVTDVADGTDP